MTSPYVTPPGVPTPTPGSYMPPGGYGQVPPPPPSPRKRGLLVTVGLVAAILLATAALVVSIVAINRPTSGPSANRTPPAALPTTAGGGDTTTADRALCNAIAPLMKRSTDQRNALVDSGPPGSAAQDAALPKFVADTKDWASDAEGVLAKYSDPPRHLSRTLQRYVDDMLLFVESVRPGPGTKYDEAAWTDSTVVMGGPMRVCYDLGVSW
jgi:hypothetical protein